MTEGQDVNQQGSQAPTQGAPNPAGNSAEPSGDHASRMKAWETENNNKSQQIAAERKALEREKAEWSQGRSQHGNYPGQAQGFQQGNYPQGNQQGQNQQIPLPSNFQELVNDLGYDTAMRVVAANNQQAGLLLSQLRPVVDQFQDAQVQFYLNNIDTKGEKLYGDEYKTNRDEVLNLITNGDRNRGVPPGCSIEYAMFVIRGGENGLKQRIVDQTYQKQEQKEQGNAGQQGAGPSPAAMQQVKGVDAAIAAAKKELGWQD